MRSQRRRSDGVTRTTSRTSSRRSKRSPRAATCASCWFGLRSTGRDSEIPPRWTPCAHWPKRSPTPRSTPNWRSSRDHTRSHTVSRLATQRLLRSTGGRMSLSNAKSAAGSSGDGINLADEFRQRTRATWAAGDWDGFSRTIRPVGSLVLDRVGVEPGIKLLDVGTGTGGNVAIPAAQRGADVVGLDITPELLEHARRRAAAAGVE